MQERRNSSTNALALRLLCSNPSIYFCSWAILLISFRIASLVFCHMRPWLAQYKRGYREEHTLQWGDNERNGVSDHQPHWPQDLRHRPLCGEVTGDQWIPRTKGQENVSIWWRHDEYQNNWDTRKGYDNPQSITKPCARHGALSTYFQWK